VSHQPAAADAAGGLRPLLLLLLLVLGEWELETPWQ
jgi:hypothetical protein